MAGLRGGQAYHARAKQTGKGTPNTVYIDKDPFTGGNIGPTRNVDNLAETDSNRDMGVSYITQTGIEGAPESYVRDSNFHHKLEGALGSLATAGTTNFTHTITPANSLSYYTFFKSLGGTLWEQFNDCKISEMTISADTGGPLTVTETIQGRQALRLTSEPAAASSLALASGPVYNFNEATVTLSGGAVATVGSFELTISNNVTVQQTDDSIPYDVVEGMREVTLGFNLIFEDLVEYNKFHYGSSSGTAQSPTLFTTSANFLFTKGTNNTIAFDLPSIAYEEFPVEPSASGEPVSVDVRARAQRGASPVLTATVKNQSAT